MIFLVKKRNLQIVIFYFTLIFAICRLGAQNNPKKPSELFSDAQIQKLESDLSDPEKNSDLIATSARAMLDLWYKQFIADKKIADQRHYPLFDPINTNANITRLIADARSRKNIAPYSLGDSPYLYRLHVVLGSVYEKKGDVPRALWSYSMALRYSKREVPIDKDVNKFTIQKRFLLMSKSWSHKDRLEEESNNRQKQSALQFNKQLELYSNAIAKCESLKRDFYAKEAQLARRRSNLADVNAVKQKRDQFCNQEKELYDSLFQIYNTDYKNHLLKKNKNEARVVYKMALLVQKTENNNHKLFRKKNEGSFLRANGDTRRENKTKNTQNTGYSQLLELAHFLDPNDSLYLQSLADADQRAGRTKEALAWQERYLALVKLQNLEPGLYKIAYLKKSQLHESLREYVQSANALENFMQLERDQNTLSQYKIRLANLHFRYTGRLKRALELFAQEEARLDRIDTSTLKKSKLWENQVLRQDIHKKSAYIFNKFNEPQKEEEKLNKAILIYKNMSQDYLQLENNKKTLDNKILNLKKQLLNSEDENLQAQYYLLVQTNKPELEKKMNLLMRRRHQLNHAKTLKRLVELAWQKKQFRKIQNMFREIINTGNSDQATLARRNLNLVEKIMSDGIMRPLFKK